MQLIKSAALITKAIASIRNRGAKLDKDIHIAAVSVLAHANQHGDSTLADKLVQAMPKGSRRLALVEYMLAFGELSVLDKKADVEAVAAGRVFKLDRSKKYDEAGAIATPWTEFKPEAAVVDAFDVQKAVAGVLARLQKASSDGKTLVGAAEALAQAKALVIALGGKAEAPAAALAAQSEEAPL